MSGFCVRRFPPRLLNLPRRIERTIGVVAGVVTLLVALLLAAPAWAAEKGGAAKPSAPSRSPSRTATTRPTPAVHPLRLGIVHPRPRLCRYEDPAQRDLRVLRLAYRVARTEREWLEGPWYLARAPWPRRSASADQPPLLRMYVKERSLWGDPPGIAPAGEEGIWDGLAPGWRRRAEAALSLDAELKTELKAELKAARGATGAGGWLMENGDPLLGSRLNSTRFFPEREIWAGPCRDWPQGVHYWPGEGSLGFRLTFRLAGETPWDLTGFVKTHEAWNALRDGRLDGLLVEDTDVVSAPRWARQGNGARWGQQPGGQQVVLRLLGQGWDSLSASGRVALSMATPRQELAELEGPAAMTAGVRFLTPLFTASAPAEVLTGDALQSRTLWLRQENPLRTLTLNVPEHPYLIRLGQAIAARWRRTLNLEVAEAVRKPAQLAALSAAVSPMVRVDVVDMEDGSLQDLWREALGEEGMTLLAVDLGAAEAQLRASLPYLPLFQQMEYVVVPSWAPEEMMGRVCPGCRTATPPSPQGAPPGGDAEGEALPGRNG